MKQHGGPWQESGICDITGVLRGRFVGIEVKVKGNRLTEKQAAFLESLQRAGALTVLVYTDVDPAVVVKRIVAGTHRLHVTMLAANGL